MNYPVLIATKGRAGQSQTIARLIQEGVKPWLFVEPQDRESYYNAYVGQVELFTLAENNKGITYVRNVCLEIGRQFGQPWFWMMDDDIREMYAVRRGKCHKQPFAKVLAAAEAHITQFKDVAIGALEYQQYAWSAKRDYVFNSYCDVAVLISVEKTAGMSYTPEVKEDRDFVLQILSRGMSSMRTCKLAFGAPKNGSNKGGLHDEYKAGLERRWSENMIRRWPGICTWAEKKDGRPDVAIDWSVFRRASDRDV